MEKNISLIGLLFDNWKVVAYARSTQDGNALWTICCLNCNQIRPSPVRRHQLNKKIVCRICSPTKRSLKKHFTNEQLNNRGHGLKQKYLKEYWAWQSMKQRCLNPNDAKYDLYGGRGIKVCSEWLSSFKRFLTDVGAAPGKEYSIDRINSNGHYVKSNVRWATIKVQNNNRRSRAWGPIHTIS